MPICQIRPPEPVHTTQVFVPLKKKKENSILVSFVAFFMILISLGIMIAMWAYILTIICCESIGSIVKRKIFRKATHQY